MLSRYSVLTRIRVAYLWQAAVTVGAMVYSWRFDQTAVDLTWFYRIGFVIAIVAFVRAAWNPRPGHMTDPYLAIGVIAAVRVMDFTQDWFLTPEPYEPIGIHVRIAFGAVGWAYLLGTIPLIDALEDVAFGRLTDPDDA